MRRNTLLGATLIGVALAMNARYGVSPIGPNATQPAVVSGIRNAVAMLGDRCPTSRGAAAAFDMGALCFKQLRGPNGGSARCSTQAGCAACHENRSPGGGGNNDPGKAARNVELHATRSTAPQPHAKISAGAVSHSEQSPRRLADILHIQRSRFPAAAPTPATHHAAYSGSGCSMRCPIE